LADYVLLLRRGQAGIVRTTIDPEIQAAVSQTVEQRAGEYLRMGIDGVGVVVIDVTSSSMAALVGSIDPRDRRTGCVNTILARRQPGSLLKPFIYTAAFGQGLLTPDGVVYDVPTAWGGYHPRNLDRDFLGAISAARALVLSRNVPAVGLLDRVGHRRMAESFRQLGLSWPAAKERYGLSLALGTAEVSLLDITNAYAALARLGRYSPLQVFSEQHPTQSVQVFSPEATYLVLRALGASKGTEPAKLIWKTGTSWQYRDAWAVALTPKYVVGIWCGKLSGKSHSALIGRNTAQPLAMEIARRVSAGKAASWPMPAAVRTRTVCAVSGAPPTAACSRVLEAEYIPGTSGDLPCALHRFSGDGPARRVVTVWPKNAAVFLAKPAEKQVETVTPTLSIRCPVNGAEYVLADPPAGSGNRLDFSAQGGGDMGQVFWFLNDRLTAVTTGRESFPWPMSPGVYKLIACDDRGQAAAIAFRVDTRQVLRASAKIGRP